MSASRRVAVALLAGALLSAQAAATWSVVVVNKLTREVAVSCATCIEDIDLVPRLPAVRPGLGVGNVQAWWDDGGGRRQIMWDGFGAGKTPQEILDDLADLSFHQRYQFGIASFDGPPVTFTGSQASAAVCGVMGENDELAWAIQGNVLTGEPVCLEAQRALVETQGDLARKVMAAMMAARAMGGDGRCSCSPSDPTGCGSPPPDFQKTAHTAFLVLARFGDAQGVCNNALGCANGAYYLERIAIGDSSDPDPILVLRDKVANWRQKQVGKPDHVLSEVFVDRQRLVADGRSRARVTVVLRDIEGTPLGHGGDTIHLRPALPGPPSARPGPVTDHGDGSYSADLVATMTPGRGAWYVVVDFGGAKPRTLWPPLVLPSDELVELHAGFASYPASSGLAVPFVLNRAVGDAGRPYRILGSFSGTSPGVDFRGVHLPLNRDRFFQFTWNAVGAPPFGGSTGLLDAVGRAQAELDLDPAGWTSFVGERLDFCALLWGPILEVTNVTGFSVEL